jgi:hypothetical protein
VFGLAAPSVTANTASTVPEFPSVTVASAIEIDTSSSEIVPVPLPPIVAPLGFERPRVRLSLGSNAVSPWTRTVTVLLVWPGAKVSVPLFGW